MIVTYKSDHMRAKKGVRIRVDEDFTPGMDIVEGFAKARGVTVYVTQSLRTPGKPVKGAVVKPAVMSNHLVGHGIDFNLIDVATDAWYNSGKLARIDKLPENVRGFIQDIRDHPKLRWGGDFKTPDCIHFDDRLNSRDPDAWDRKFKELWHDC